MSNFCAGEKRGLVRLAACLSVAFSLAWLNRFVQDDAFISFRYARHAAEGLGLVWNLGERVEGYTNFLWTVCLVPAFWLGCEIVTYTYGLSLAAFALTLFLSERLATAWWRDRGSGRLAVLLLGLNYSFSCYATGGLETQFGIAWVLGAVWLIVRWQSLAAGGAGLLLLAALASACAILTRMDASVLLLPFWCWAGVTVLQEGGAGRRAAFLGASFCGAVPVVLWLLWRHQFYGAWVPNTFLIKAGGASWLRGLYYVGLFYLVYGFWLVAPLVWRSAGLLWGSGLGLCALLSWLLWHLYVISVGGDFMEFRLMMPAFPFLAMALAGLIRREQKRWKLGAALLLLSACSGLQWADLWPYPYPGIQTIKSLRAYHDEWREVGTLLNRCLGDERRHVKIAVTAAGIIPFLTGCETLDLLGLNDREVAIDGDPVPSGKLGVRPGHAKVASSRQVQERGVCLLLNHPWIVENLSALGRTKESVITSWCYSVPPERVHSTRVRFYPYLKGAPEMRVVAWPFGDGRHLLSIYLGSNPYVDAAIKRSQAVVLDE